MEEYRLLMLHALLTEAFIELSEGTDEFAIRKVYAARSQVVKMLGREPTVLEVQEATECVDFALLAWEVKVPPPPPAVAALTPPQPHLSGDCAKVCGNCWYVYCVLLGRCPNCDPRRERRAQLGWGPETPLNLFDHIPPPDVDDWHEPL